MNKTSMAAAAFKALTASKNGPSIYDVCDPVLHDRQDSDSHLIKFYRRSLRNPALRPLLWRAGLPALRDPARLEAVRAALVRARDEESPDWAAIGQPVAELMQGLPPTHPRPKPISAPASAPDMAEIERIIRLCGEHLLKSYAGNGFIPTYAAFNLIGDPDFHSRELIVALTGLQARGYKNSTLMFNLARVFIANSPAAGVINPPWTGIAEPMWEPVQIRHRSAYYDAFFVEALLSYIESELIRPEEITPARRAIDDMLDFCLRISREEVLSHDGSKVSVITALAPPPHPRFSKYFAQIKEELGFGIYVPDCDTTACSISVATQAGSTDPILDQPLLDFYAGYQVNKGDNEPRVTVPLNDNVDYEGAIATWIDNLRGERPYGNDLDPTLNLDVLEVSFRNCARWQVVETPKRLETVHKIIRFQRKLAETGVFADPRAHIYYLPELYSAYFGRCYATLRALPQQTQAILDPDNSFDVIRRHVLAYVQNDLTAHEMNPFDAALALMALGYLGAPAKTFNAALDCIVRQVGEGGRRSPFKAYEWNKMKTPTRILVGGPEVTSAFVLMGLALARRTMTNARA